MTPITDSLTLCRYRILVNEMLTDEVQFDSSWIQAKNWKVVPVEDANHFTRDRISHITAALKKKGELECFAIATEPLDPLPSCYRLDISTDDLESFNQELGLFRFLLTSESRLWAISCNELYVLFGAGELLLEELLGERIQEARTKFMEFALPLSKGDPADPFVSISNHYAQI